MDDVDAKLVNDGEWLSDGKNIDEVGWLELARRAMELLGVALGRELILDSRRPVLSWEDGVSVWAIEHRTPGPADVTVRAIVSAIVQEQRLTVEARIFYYVGGVRVGPRIERPPAPHRAWPFDYGELLHARLIVDSNGKPAWETGEWEQGFTDDEWAKFERW